MSAREWRVLAAVLWIFIVADLGLAFLARDWRLISGTSEVAVAILVSDRARRAE